MEESGVRIVELPPMRVAYSLGFGASPEVDAWSAIVGYGRSNNYLSNLKQRRFFGFNNPSPSTGTPNYGYEQWMTVDTEAKDEGNVNVKQFPGGRFAVLRCESLAMIGTVWQRLVEWWKSSPYREAEHPDLPGLEELLNPEILISPEGNLLLTEETINACQFDLYFPIGK